MVAPHRRFVALAVAVAASLCIGVTVVAAQEDDAPQATGDDALLERLADLEPTLPPAPAPTAVEIDDEATWGSIDGDITGAAAILGTLQPELLSLYVDADDADGPVADAVAEVTRGWLDLQQGLDQLAIWEGADLIFPIDASDDDEVATDADELRGRAETGLRLVLDARQRHLDGYTTLREVGAAEPAAQSRFDARAADAETFDQDLRPLVRRLLSLRSTQVLVPVERFETSAPGVDARARSMRVTCVDRDAYLESGPDAAPGVADPGAGEGSDPGATAPGTTDPGAVTVPQVERADCPDLPDEQAVTTR
ncbi:MAG: hypothetical protein WEB09_05270 [Nitriliruptor sp.]